MKLIRRALDPLYGYDRPMVSEVEVEGIILYTIER